MLGQHRLTRLKVLGETDDGAALTAAIIDWARQYTRYGFRQVTALLRAESWRLNDKRAERIWRREDLKVSARQLKRRPPALSMQQHETLNQLETVPEQPATGANVRRAARGDGSIPLFSRRHFVFHRGRISHPPHPVMLEPTPLSSGAVLSSTKPASTSSVGSTKRMPRLASTLRIAAREAERKPLRPASYLPTELTASPASAASSRCDKPTNTRAAASRRGGGIDPDAARREACMAVC